MGEPGGAPVRPDPPRVADRGRRADPVLQPAGCRPAPAPARRTGHRSAWRSPTRPVAGGVRVPRRRAHRLPGHLHRRDRQVAVRVAVLPGLPHSRRRRSASGARRGLAGGVGGELAVSAAGGVPDPPGAAGVVLPRVRAGAVVELGVDGAFPAGLDLPGASSGLGLAPRPGPGSSPTTPRAGLVRTRPAPGERPAGNRPRRAGAAAPARRR